MPKSKARSAASILSSTASLILVLNGSLTSGSLYNGSEDANTFNKVGSPLLVNCLGKGLPALFNIDS